MESILADPPLVGRQQEFERLYADLDSALHWKGKTVFVSGEAGAGKTRLINEFLNAAKQKVNVATLKGWCLSNAAIPYFPFIEAFKSHFRAKKLEQKKTVETNPPKTELIATENETVSEEEVEIRAWLTGSIHQEQSRKISQLSAEGWQNLTFSVITKSLLSIAGKAPAILFIDDMQWADSATLALVHYISRVVPEERILIIATYRSDELVPDAEGHHHPLIETLRLMRREDLIEEIRLSRLPKDDVSAIAEKMIGGTVNLEFSKMLSEESLGNPLFVVESLRMLSERGSLYEANGEWRLSVNELSIPNKIKDIILRRLGRLNSSQRRVLEAASVIGEKFDPKLLADVLNQDILEVLEMLYAISKSTSLVVAEDELLKFDHARSRDAVYEGIPVPLKKGYHFRIAEKLVDKSKKAKDFPSSEIAYHYIQSGSKENALQYSLVAGEEARARYSNLEALGHFKYALDNMADFPEDADMRLRALEGLGNAYFGCSRLKEAEDVFVELARLQTGKARLRAYRKAIMAVFIRGKNPKRIIELGELAEPYAASDRLESARIRLHKASALGFKKRKEEFEAALQVYEEEYSLGDVCHALSALCLLETLFGSTEKGLSQALRSVAVSKDLLEGEGVANLYAAHSLMVAGLFPEAFRKYNEVIQIAKKRGGNNALAQSSEMISVILDNQGKTEEALLHLLQARKYYEQTDLNWTQDKYYQNLMRTYAKLGNLPAAQECMQWLKDHKTEFSALDFEGSVNRFEELGYSVYFAANNQWDKSMEFLNKALEKAAETRRLPLVAQATLKTNYAWILNKQGRHEEAQVQLGEIQRVLNEVDRRYSHICLDACLLARWNVVADEELEMRLDIINVSREMGKLLKVEMLVPKEFEVIDPPSDSALENGSLNMKEKYIRPFEVVTIKLTMKAPRHGTFSLAPVITYIDESGETQTCKTNQITVTVKPTKPKFEALPGRVATGFEELDALLLGGIPEKYAVALTSPSIEEKELLVKWFLEVGARTGEATFLVSGDAANGRTLVEEYPSNFFLFICNPQADSMVPSLPNVVKLKGVESLTEIDIALTKVFRKLPASLGARRICVDLISDVLLQHHALITRKWLNALLPILKSQGFTILAVVNQHMHLREEVQAIISQFDGEIGIFEKGTTEGLKRILQIRRLRNQKYSEREIVLNREKLRTF